MQQHSVTFALLVVLGLPVQSSALDNQEPDPLFASDELIELTIEAPFATIMRERSTEDYSPAVLRYSDADGAALEFDVGIRARGEFRRSPEICNFAPLRLNFQKSKTAGTIFAHQDKLKLVTHCQTNSRHYEQFVISEYLAYRILNLVTDLSYRARLIRITYIDTADENRTYARLAMFIEHRDRLAKRTFHTTVDTERISFKDLDHAYTNIVSVFHYFIGNTDYSPIAPSPDDTCCHNQTLFANEEGEYFSVPYDFDLSGLVNAKPYAKPNPRYKLRSVRQRRFRGRCFNNFYVVGSVGRFFEQRDNIYRLINAQELMTDPIRRSMLRFVDKFFESLSSPEEIKKVLVDNCA